MGLLDQFTQFAKTPEGQGLLSAAFGGLATAQRGAPLNSIGRAGMAGLAGYSGAIDREQQQADNAFQQQYRTMQMDAMKQAQAKQQAEQQWRQKLPGLMTPTLQGQTEQSRMLLDQMGPDASPEDVQAMNQGARMPATGFSYGVNEDALQRHLMDPSSPYLDDLIKQQMFPKADDYRVVGSDLVKIGKGGVTVAHKSERPDNIPSDQKLYNLAKEQGFKGSFMDFLRERVSTTEGAKAGFDLIEITTPDGQTYKVPRSRAVSMAGGTTPAPSPVVTPPPKGGFKGSGYAGGSAAAAQTDQVAIISKELENARKAGNARDVQALENELNRLTGKTTSAPGLRVQSEADKVAAAAKAKADADAKTARDEKQRQFKDFKTQLNFAKQLLGKGPTSSGVGALVDSALGNIGVSTESSQTATALENVGSWLIQNVPKAPGAQSEAELRDYKIAAGLVGDRTKPVADRLAAVNAALSMIELWEKGGSSSDGVVSPKQIKRTGNYGGRKVIEYTDGSVEYAN